MYYTVRRDDDQLRVVICPRCRKSNIEKQKTHAKIMIQPKNKMSKRVWPLWGFHCLKKNCGVDFGVYPEDGFIEITKGESLCGIKEGKIDFKNGRDQHDHCPYVHFDKKGVVLHSFVGFKI